MEKRSMSDDGPVRGHEQIVERTIELFRSLPMPPGVDLDNLEMPPASTKTLDLRYEEFVPARSLRATVVASEKYANAVGLLQGGFISATFDDLIALRRYLTARGPA